MRNSLFIILISTIQSLAVTGYAQNTRLTLDMKNLSVKAVLQQIEQQSEFYFLYNSELIDVQRKIDLTVKNATIDDILNQVFSDGKVDILVRDRHIVLTANGESVSQQNRKVSGKVTDPSGATLPGVSVVVKGTTNGIITDVYGKFSISNIPENATLQFSFVGMKMQEIVVGNKTTVNVVLAEQTIGLEEVVAVGYGTARKKDLTGSISVIKNDDLVKMATPQVGQLLQGRVAGMQVSNSDQSPGADLQIAIRGYNSLNGNNAPLIVIDGVIGVDLQSVNPSDIKTIQILKDASSTAIYGSRGSNGVILVETNRGNSGKINISFSTYYGIQTVLKKLDLLTAEEQYNMINTHEKSHNPNPNYEFVNTINNISNPVIKGRGTDWQDVIFQSAQISDTHFNINSGNEKTQFSLSLDYLTQDGVIKRSSYEKGSIRLNFDHKITKWLTIGNNFNFYKSNQKNIRENSGYGTGGNPVTMAAAQFSPIVPVYAKDGTFNGSLISGASDDNPLLILEGIDNPIKRDYIIDNIFAEAEIMAGLKFKTSASYIGINTLHPTYITKELKSALNLGKASVSSSFYSHFIFENTLSYNKLINLKHRLNAVVGVTTETEHTYGYNISTAGFATETLKYNNISLAESVTDYGSSDTYSTLASTLGRINYSYKDKYLITLTGRIDGSSKFAKNNKWGFFPSGSVGWRLSEEPMIKAIKVISNAKVRVSYGSIGSQAISPYSSLSAYSVGVNYQRGNLNFSNGAVPSRIANTDLRWETTNQLDAGLDLGLFKNRLNFTFDTYSKKTSDLLYSKTVSYFTGYTSQLQNIGTMENTGWETDISADILNGKFKWNLSGNFSITNNKVLSLGGDSIIFRSSPTGSLGSMGYGQSGILKPGESISSFYGFVWDGIFQSQKEVDALLQNGAIVGGVKFKDLNGDGVINDLDKKILGTGIPKYTIGISTNLSYKGFDLNIMVQGVYGNEIAFVTKYYLEQPGDPNYNSTRNVLDYWTPENHSNTMQAIGTPNGFGFMSSRVLEDGSFVRLKNVSLGYTLPGDILNKLKLSNLRIYVSAQNLLTFTKYSGYDPEINSGRGSNNSDPQLDQGYDMGGYPGIKQVNVGLNVNF